MGCKKNLGKIYYKISTCTWNIFIRKDFNVLKNNVVNIKWENSFTHKHSQVYLNLEQVGVCTWERREELFNSACFAHYSFYPASFLPSRILGLDSIQPWCNLITYPSSYLSLSKIFYISLQSSFISTFLSFSPVQFSLYVLSFSPVQFSLYFLSFSPVQFYFYFLSFSPVQFYFHFLSFSPVQFYLYFLSFSPVQFYFYFYFNTS